MKVTRGHFVLGGHRCGQRESVGAVRDSLTGGEIRQSNEHVVGRVYLQQALNRHNLEAGVNGSLRSYGAVAGRASVRGAAFVALVVGIGCGDPAVVQPTTPPVSTSEPFSPATMYANSYCTDGQYPVQWVWNPATLRDSLPRAATAADGAPRIRQIRGGQVIATYTALGGTGATTDENNTDGHDVSGGAFHRTPYTNWADGDVFEVYPAVYEGTSQQPWIGPLTRNYQTFMAGDFAVPKNITIRGITVNGVRPVIRNPSDGGSNNTLGQGLIYVDRSENITIENIEIHDSPTGGGLGKAAIYVNGAKNLTLRDVRIVGFKRRDANGIFGTLNNSGTLRLERVDLDGNGGGNGPEHNIYINASETDPNYTVHMTGSFTHGAYYGHLFKSRAQVNILEGNYFMGQKWDGVDQAENYLADFPNGGRVTLRNNVFVKNRSGDNSNAMSVTYAMEGLEDARPNSVLIEHNTFVALDRTYDGFHPIYPMQFFYPARVPGDAAFPVSNVTVAHNAFVGYCRQSVDFMDYRGQNALELNFNQIDMGFRLRDTTSVGNAAIRGTAAYSHLLRGVTRATARIGARD